MLLSPSRPLSPFPRSMPSDRSAERMLGGICGICCDCLTVPPPPLHPSIAGDVDFESCVTLSLLAGGSTPKPGGGLAMMSDDETPVAFLGRSPPTDIVETPAAPPTRTRVELLFLAVLFD